MMNVPFFTAAPHGDVLKLLIEIAVLLFTARALGKLAQRLGQPSVVGEILAGILLGPSCLSGAFPLLGRWLLPASALQGHLLEAVSLLGALFLLLATGLETDLKMIRRHARVAIGVATGGLVLPLLSGFVLGELLPDRLLAANGSRLVFSLFVATAMSISAIPVIAKVLMDMDLMRRDIGQTIVAAAIIDDTTGWILLSIVASLARGEAVTAASVAQAVVSVLVFMALSFTAGAWLVKRALDVVQDRAVSQERILTLVVTLTFAWAALTHALNLEPVLGAFVMGILLGQLPRLPEEVRHRVKSIVLGVFTPIFFAVAGLKVNARNLFEPELAALALAVIVVATAGKVIGHLRRGAAHRPPRPLDLARLRRRAQRPRSDGDHRRHHRPLARHPRPGHVLDHRGDGDGNVADGSFGAPLGTSAHRARSTRSARSSQIRPTCRPMSRPCSV